MAYATYDYYVNTFYGDSLTADVFDKYAARASDYIDYITMGKAAGYNDENNQLAKCCCALAEKFGAFDAEVSVAADAVASETVGSHSISYRSSADIKAGLDSALLAIAQMYLLSTGLLYRGAICIRRIP